jgi:hypothetical protein
MIGSNPRRRGRVDPKAVAKSLRRDPDPVECKERTPRGEGRRRGRALEARVQPAQRPTPKVPFVQVTHQDRGKRGLLVQMVQQFPHLAASFVGPQSQVRRHDPQGPMRNFDENVQSTAWFMGPDREIDPLHGAHRKAGQKCVTVLAVLAQHGHSADGFGIQHGSELVKEMASGHTGLNLLERYHVRVDLLEHGGNALGCELTIPANGAVHVVSGENESGIIANCVDRRAPRLRYLLSWMVAHVQRIGRRAVGGKCRA